MIAISKAAHYQLTESIRNLLLQLPANTADENYLRQNLTELEQAFEKYNGQINELHLIITTYRAMEGRIKVSLRKQQILQAKQKSGEAQ